MTGQAAVTINGNQWNVWVANTYAELTTGLRGRDSIPPGTGMLFVLPSKQAVSVDTREMSFPMDIIFISENAVVDVASNIQPGYLVTEETPCDMFLEVNAGEAAGVDVGDTVNVEMLYTIVGGDLTQIMSFAIPLATLGFVCAMAGGMAKLMGGSASSPKQLSRGSAGNQKELSLVASPSGHHAITSSEEELRKAVNAMITEENPHILTRCCFCGELIPEEQKGDVKIWFEPWLHNIVWSCPKCYRWLKSQRDPDLAAQLVLRKRAEKGGYVGHHSMWLTAEQRKELEEKYGMVAVRWAEEATKPGDIKAVETAAEYYYRKVKEALGLGHLSPELSEEQIRRLRDLLGLPEEVPPRQKGYIDDNRAWVKAVRRASY